MDSNVGLAQKNLGHDFSIAFLRMESTSRKAIQDNFVIHMPKDMLKFRHQFHEMGLSNGGFHGQKPFMFSDYIKPMDRVQNGVSIFVSSCLLDRDGFGLRNPFFAFEHRYGVQKLGLGASKGELGLSIRLNTMTNEKSGHEDIQGGSHRIDDSPNITLNERIKLCTGIGDEQLPFRIVRIRLYDYVVRAASLPSD